MKVGCVSIKFDPKWILQNQVSGKSSVVEEVLKALKEMFSDGVVLALSKEFHRCEVLVASEKLFDRENVASMLKEHAKAVADADMKVDVQDVEKDKIKDMLLSAIQKPNEKECEFFKNEFSIDFTDDFDSGKDEDGCTTHVQVDDLIGLDGFKKWIDEISKLSGAFAEITKSTNVLKNISYLISINRGNGLSTILQLMTETFKKSGFVEFEGKTDFVEWKLRYCDKPEEFPSFDGLLRTLSRVENAGGFFKGIVAIDVEEWLDHLIDKRFDLLLKFVWEKRNDIVFVFTIPYVENTILDKLYDRIDDVISTRVMKFVPPSDEQYFEYFSKIFSRYNIAVDKDAYSCFVMKITDEKNDGKFYGFNTVKKVADEMLYNIISDAAKNDTELPEKITADMFSRIYDLKVFDGLSGLEQLQGMVALTDVKNKVKEILSTVKLQKELHAKDNTQLRPCFHMMFTGNPGTGKTVVARIIGRIFKEEGLLSIGNFFEVSRKDFIGKFVGHTAPKTMEICRNACGSVLFIDEAYLLADDKDGFSAEAIGTLIAEMENNRDKMIVIFAGYEKELDELFDMNPGLRDRIPYKIDFPNYNRKELEEIFYIQLSNKVKYDAAFEKSVKEFFETFPDSVLNDRNFSNGRFVRNLAERIISKAALRFEMANIGINDFELTDTDFSVAVADTDFQKLFCKVKHVRTIGF